MVMNVTREEVEQLLNKMAMSLGVKVLRFKRYSKHPEDSHLYTVLCEAILKDKSYHKYITWVANICPGIEGFGHGHYYEGYTHEVSADTLLEKAKEDYNNREFGN